MDMRQLQVFVRVAEPGSFSKAAQVLDSTQSVLSLQIQQLEREIGKHLLYRNGRGVEPTDIGKRFMAQAVGILRQLESAKDEANDDQQAAAGTVVIGMPPQICSYLGAPLVARFCAKYPKAKISLAEGPTASIYTHAPFGGGAPHGG